MCHLVFQWTGEGVASSWGCHTYFSPENIIFTGSRHGIPTMMPRPCPSGSKKLSIGAFIWSIVCFCTSNGSFRIWPQVLEIYVLFMLTNRYAIHSRFGKMKSLGITLFFLVKTEHIFKFLLKYQMTQPKVHANGSKSNQNIIFLSEMIVYFRPTCTGWPCTFATNFLQYERLCDSKNS